MSSPADGELGPCPPSYGILLWIAGSQQAWWRSTGAALLEGLIQGVRALWLVAIFLPVALSAPLALSWNIYRAEWMELLRRTLEAGGACDTWRRISHEVQRCGMPCSYD